MKTHEHRHWTEDSPEDFVHKIVGDFVRFIEVAMGKSITQKELAKRVGVTDGRVSQVLNNPGNMSLKTAVQFSRAVGAKVSIVGYCDGDPNNVNGPISADVFTECWASRGKPRDCFALMPDDSQTQYLPLIADFELNTLKIERKAHNGPEYAFAKRNTSVGTPGVVGGF